jgi:NAD+ synthase (glutamine-hydrolysing)
MVRIALAQINPTVGDIDGNVALITDAVETARRAGAQVVALPELAVTGYPPEDLLLKKGFIKAGLEAVNHVARASGDLLVVCGYVDADGPTLFNAAAVCHEGKRVATYHKQQLPNYGVFDERRYFHAGRRHILFDTNLGVLGVCVCEDVWFADGPAISQGDAGAQIVININASPFHKGKLAERIAMLGERARRAHASIAYVNAVGGQDELVFDGGSVVVGPDGETVAVVSQFSQEIAIVDVPLGSERRSDVDSVERIALTLPEPRGRAEAMISAPISADEEIYRALELGLRDYAHKNGFVRAVLGLSGGVDSSLTATIAADALGPDNVLGVIMPSEYSTSHSVDDAKALVANLGIERVEIPIRNAYRAYLEMLTEVFGPAEMGLAEENLQARIRGTILMAISNRYGHLVLATGNKSELAVGYATLYGDMAGGFAVLKDVLKTEVYALARYRNSISPAIPDNVLIKPPSAELRPGQKDADTLPPYDVLDGILEAYIEHDASPADIVARGFDRDTVTQAIRMVDRAEYKRRQAAPGPKVTTKAFGRDRRLPITNRWSPRH